MKLIKTMEQHNNEVEKENNEKQRGEETQQMRDITSTNKKRNLSQQKDTNDQGKKKKLNIGTSKKNQSKRKIDTEKDGTNDYFEVEKILAHKIKFPKKKYKHLLKIKWEGYKQPT